ncbi:MAG: UDP-glucose--hexose-1-phosphate uridylyltransferase [Candidatus Cohnella colombiensis]|uniref:Galactose-1-phosphate uridylyltransferase n=1 Tax=Candidatus Cohnella colombiensis TaxID=3121368 RepID=A0AA95EVF2_9BACL|nr:MAG: UDP-glucose--hexose-1-phosphate uridylyltransferase [Cohnella sp.]
MPDETLTIHIERLLTFAMRQKLIDPLDLEMSRNAMLDLFSLMEPEENVPEIDSASLPESPVPLLDPLLDEAVQRGLIEGDTVTFRDLFDARIMGLLMPRPSEIQRKFIQHTKDNGIQAATDWFYQMNIDSNYIRMDRILKNGYWKHKTTYGELEITINLSKPEKDPREIALLKTLPQSSYPKCLLCKENVGYSGRLDHPARQNIRILPLTLEGKEWFFQYSPYVYYNEHSIVLSSEHVPMVISPETFARLLDFIEQFPHYFVGSNADLPIVGGSILNHDHFQAGRHVFPMEVATVQQWHSCVREPEVNLGIVEWPMSVIRMQSKDRDALLRAAVYVLEAWREYNDPHAEIVAFSGDGVTRVPHNTITPIARKKGDGTYEFDLVLRNNRTSEEHPDGIFHPHQQLHHIKKENIGLIEVMGLAVLPGRLQTELGLVADILTGNVAFDPIALQALDHPLHHHLAWIADLVELHGTNQEAPTAKQLLQGAVGGKFSAVLHDAGVYKRDEAGQEAFKYFLTKASII